MSNFAVHFYVDSEGRKPARDWMDSLPEHQRNAARVALREVLGRHGLDVCASSRGKQLGNGLFELRVNQHAAGILKSVGLPGPPERSGDRIMLRIFGHAHGNKMVVVLGGYDKSRDPSPRRQEREIRVARDRLTNFRQTPRQHGTER